MWWLNGKTKAWGTEGPHNTQYTIQYHTDPMDATPPSTLWGQCQNEQQSDGSTSDTLPCSFILLSLGPNISYYHTVFCQFELFISKGTWYLFFYLLNGVQFVSYAAKADKINELCSMSSSYTVVVRGVNLVVKLGCRGSWF